LEYEWNDVLPSFVTHNLFWLWNHLIFDYKFEDMSRSGTYIQ
jgi:hypothetical protein